MPHWTASVVAILLAGISDVACAQVNCEAIPHGPARTDCYLDLSQFYRGQSDLARANQGRISLRRAGIDRREGGRSDRGVARDRPKGGAPYRRRLNPRVLLLPQTALTVHCDPSDRADK